MGRPRLPSPSVPSGVAAANRIRELAGVTAPKPAPPPLPAPPPTRPDAPTSQKTPEQVRYEEFLAKAESLPEPEQGSTRLFRVGETAANYQPPKTIKQWGQEVPYDQWREQILAAQGPAGPNPKGAAGRWATDAPKELDFYINDNPLDAPIYYFDVPDADQYNVSKTPYLKNSRNPTREFVLPDDNLKTGKRLMSLAPLLLAPAVSQDQ